MPLVVGVRVLVVVLKELWWGESFSCSLPTFTTCVKQSNSVAQIRLHRVSTLCLDRRMNVGSLVGNARQGKIKKLLCKGESEIKIVVHVVNVFISANNGILSCISALGQTRFIPTKRPVEVTILMNFR